MERKSKPKPSKKQLPVVAAKKKAPGIPIKRGISFSAHARSKNNLKIATGSSKQRKKSVKQTSTQNGKGKTPAGGISGSTFTIEKAPTTKPKPKPSETTINIEGTDPNPSRTTVTTTGDLSNRPSGVTITMEEAESRRPSGVTVTIEGGPRYSLTNYPDKDSVSEVSIRRGSSAMTIPEMTDSATEVCQTCQSSGNYHLHIHSQSEKQVTLISNFKRRMSNRVHPEESQESKVSEIKKKLSRRINAKVLKEKLKKRLVGEKSTRKFRPGMCKYLDCFPLKWPRKISRNTLFHDYIFYLFAFAQFASDGYLLACLFHGFGFEYNLYAMGVLSTRTNYKKDSLITSTSLYIPSGIIVTLLLVSIIAAIVGTKGYYSANRRYHYWYIYLIGGILLCKCGIGIYVITQEPFCKEVKPFVDKKLTNLVRNYYTGSPVIRHRTLNSKSSYSPPVAVLREDGKTQLRVRNFLHASMMDVIQNYYFCCGVNGFRDYQDPSFRFPKSDIRYRDWRPKIPRTCCTPKWNRNAACSLEVPTNPEELHSKLFQEGCSRKLHLICINVFYYLGKGMFLFVAWQSIFFFACLVCIAIQIRQIKRLERSSRFKVDPKIMERPLETRRSDNAYDLAERKMRTLDKNPNSTLLPKWYRDFLNSYRHNRGQYIYNRTHAAKYGFEPQAATTILHLRSHKLDLPLEKWPHEVPIATFERPKFTKQFNQIYKNIRNRAVLSRYDVEINPWITSIGLDRKEIYDPDELAIVQYNESDWEDNKKRKLLIESDTLANYHTWGLPRHKYEQPKKKKDNKQQDPDFVPFKRKPGYPLGPAHLKSSWQPPRIEVTSAYWADQPKAKASKLADLAQEPDSIFQKPKVEDRGKATDIAWRIGETESPEDLPQQKKQKVKRKMSPNTLKLYRFLHRRDDALSPPKNEQPTVAPVRLNYLDYEKPLPLKPEPLKYPPSVVSTIPASSLASLSNQSIVSRRDESKYTITGKVPPKKTPSGYYAYPGDDLYRASRKERKRQENAETIVNPKSKVPFSEKYYRQEKKSNLNRHVWEETETTHIGIPEKTEQPKTYVNLRLKKWEEKAKQFTW